MEKDIRVIKDAVYLIDDTIVGGRYYECAESGWDFDKRGLTPPNNPKIGGFLLCTDTSNEYEVYIKRKVVPQKKGKIGFYQGLTYYYGEGFYIRFYDAGEKKQSVTLEISAKDGLFTVNGQKIPVALEKRYYGIAVNFDLDKKRAEVFINDINCGTHKLTAKSISLVKIGVEADKETCISPHSCRMWINYLICDKFYCNRAGAIGDVWKLAAKGNAMADKRTFPENSNIVVYTVVTADKKPAVLTRKFEKTDGKVCFEIKYHTDKAGGKAQFSLTEGRNDAVTVYDTGDNLTTGEVPLRTHHINVWQTLRIEADIPSGLALIKLNGKKCGTVRLEKGTKSVDGIKISYSCKDGGTMRFSDIFVFPINPEPVDYVPVPVAPGKKDYYVGMNVCSLWRNGTHIGWDTISAYDENKTYLGYYDEGLPEVADWEIKWLVEHGVDFELYCWYNSQANAPIMRTGLSDAIHGGHFHAKYGDMMKFAMIWEAANCAHPTIEGFRNHIVPYWMDYFFSDSRYFTLDNKVLISVFGANQLIKDFGSEEAVAEQLDYVREQVKSLGYDGAVFIACSNPSETIKKCGFDAVYAYNWGPEGCSADFTKAQINSQRKSGICHVIPTVSTGFNKIGWGDRRTPLMTCEDMGEMFRWIKEDVLPASDSDEDWKKKFLMLSTWNEYGEGTYMCPANLNGFGYLDEVRKAFTYGPEEHTDIRPDANQLDRLGYIYPKGRSILKTQQLMPVPFPDEHVGFVDISLEKWSTENGLVIWEKDGKICGKSEGYDPQIIMKNLDIDAESVKNVRIKIRGGAKGAKEDSTVLYFVTDTEDNWSESKGCRNIIRNDVAGEYNYFVGELKTWKGRITGFRIDPISAEGEFELESIELLTDTTSPIITVNGKVHESSVLAWIKNGTAYIPYEHNKPYAELKFYHEWYKEDRTLYLCHKDKNMCFTEGKDYVLVNGKKKQLPEPLEFYDSLPMLNLNVLCELCGFTYSIDGRYINIEYKD